MSFLIGCIVIITLFEIGFICLNLSQNNNSKKSKWDKSDDRIKKSAIAYIVTFIILISIYNISLFVKSLDHEVWSGTILSVNHEEEWEEWIEPEYETNDKGKEVLVRDGYYKHHDAYNEIKTSDNGTYQVTYSPDRSVRLNDGYPNTTDELAQIWKVGEPTASVHSYKNKVQASNSLFKPIEGVSEDDYELFDYPDKVEENKTITRILGDVPNKDEAIRNLNKWNSYLNKTIENDEGKKVSYKQVNLIFVNLKGYPISAAYALQNKWEKGNKNDYIVTFNLNDEGIVEWFHPITWSEVEHLNYDLQDYFAKTKITDFNTVVDDVAKMVESDFTRKEFADFEYLQIEIGTGTKVILSIIVCAFIAFLIALYLGLID